MENKAFTLRNPVSLLRELVTDCKVSAGFLDAPDNNAVEFLPYKAIWDTGATNSVIDKKVAEELGLIPNGIRQVYHANGSERVNSYKVNIVLPNNIMVQMVNVTEGDLNGAQVLIGMDIISLGDFALTHRNNGTVFSFQVPSTHEYDFVKQIQREREEQEAKRKKRR